MRKNILKKLCKRFKRKTVNLCCVGDACIITTIKKFLLLEIDDRYIFTSKDSEVEHSISKSAISSIEYEELFNQVTIELNNGLEIFLWGDDCE